MTIQWTDDLATGIEKIDGQHRELYAQVAALHEAMRANRLDVVPAMIDFLARYTAEHFATEEAHMAAEGYPGLAAHRAAHAAFVEEFRRHEAGLAERITPSAVVALSSWLGEWLRDHVRRVDADMARFLRPRLRRGP